MPNVYDYLRSGESKMRTVLQCQASGCDGCVVCDSDKYTPEEVARYRKHERTMELYVDGRRAGRTFETLESLKKEVMTIKFDITESPNK